jgi:hypothetical protein
MSHWPRNERVGHRSHRIDEARRGEWVLKTSSAGQNFLSLSILIGDGKNHLLGGEGETGRVVYSFEISPLRTKSREFP